MNTQSRTWQNKIISAAIQHGSIDKLYWFIQMKMPAALGGGYAAAHSPVRCIPVIPVTTDPETSKTCAFFLQLAFQHANQGRGIYFEVALTDCDILDSETASKPFVWYILGNEPPTPPAIYRDMICPHCGQIQRIEVRETLDFDCDCSPVPTARQLAQIGLSRTLSSWVDGNAWLTSFIPK